MQIKITMKIRALPPVQLRLHNPPRERKIRRRRPPFRRGKFLRPEPREFPAARTALRRTTHRLGFENLPGRRRNIAPRRPLPAPLPLGKPARKLSADPRRLFEMARRPEKISRGKIRRDPPRSRLRQRHHPPRAGLEPEEKLSCQRGGLRPRRRAVPCLSGVSIRRARRQKRRRQDDQRALQVVGENDRVRPRRSLEIKLWRT